MYAYSAHIFLPLARQRTLNGVGRLFTLVQAMGTQEYTLCVSNLMPFSPASYSDSTIPHKAKHLFDAYNH